MIVGRVYLSPIWSVRFDHHCDCERSTYEFGHVEDTVLDWMAAVDGELQVQLLLLGILSVLLDGLVNCWFLSSDISLLLYF